MENDELEKKETISEQDLDSILARISGRNGRAEMAELALKSSAGENLMQNFEKSEGSLETGYTLDDVRAMEAEPLEDLEVTEDVKAACRETGALNLLAVAAQVYLDGGRGASLETWVLAAKIGRDGWRQVLSAFADRHIFQPIFSAEYSSAFGYWTHDALDACIARMPAGKRAVMESASELERAEMEQTLALLYRFGQDVRIFRGDAQRQAFTMRYRTLYGDAYIRSVLGMEEPAYQQAIQDALAGLGQSCLRAMLKLRDERSQTTKRVMKAKRPWVCNLLQWLYPETCTDEFFRTWEPCFGLRAYEQDILAIIRSVCLDIPGAGEGQALLAQFMGSAPSLELACESCNTACWRMAGVLDEIRSVLREPIIRDAMLYGIPFGSLAMRHNVKQVKDPNFDGSHIKLDYLALPERLFYQCFYTFGLQTLEELASMLWPREDHLKRVISIWGVGNFHVFRAYIYRWGYGDVLSGNMEQQHSLSSANALLHLLSIMVGDAEEHYSLVESVAHLSPSEAGDFFLQFFELLLGWNKTFHVDLTEEEFDLVESLGRYYLPEALLAQVLDRPREQVLDDIDRLRDRLMPVLKNIASSIALRRRPNFLMSQARSNRMPPATPFYRDLNFKGGQM